MDLNLDNKVIIVSGGSKGIGLGIVNSLVKEKAIPFIIGRDEKSIQSVVKKHKLEGRQIHYFIGIAGMSQLLALVTPNNILTVYAAKKIKIHPTLFLISILAGLVALVTTFLLFNNLLV